MALISGNLQDDDLEFYGEYLKNLHKDMQARFSDLLTTDIPTWVTIPFEVNAADVDISLQETLIKLKSDEILQAKFKDGKHNIWKTNDTAK